MTAFHQDYRMISIQDTLAATLLRAAEIGRDAGLKFVYAGNLPGSRRMGGHTLPRLQHDACPQVRVPNS